MIKFVKDKILAHQFIRFVLTGVLNTAFGYGVFAIFIWIGVHYTFAVLFGTILGALFNFKTIGTFVFKSRDNSLIWRFLLVYAGVYVVNIIALKYLRVVIQNDYACQAILIPLIALTSYTLNKNFVYSKNEETSAQSIDARLK